MSFAFDRVDATRSSLLPSGVRMGALTMRASSNWLFNRQRWLQGFLRSRRDVSRSDRFGDSVPIPGVTTLVAIAAPRIDRREPLTAAQLCEAGVALTTFLDRAADDRRRWPSLALLECFIGKCDPGKMDSVPNWVLRHAAQTLDRLEDDLLAVGLLGLRQHIEQALRPPGRQLGTHEGGSQLNNVKRVEP